MYLKKPIIILDCNQDFAQSLQAINFVKLNLKYI